MASELLAAQADLDLGGAAVDRPGLLRPAGVQSLLFAPMLQGCCAQAASPDGRPAPAPGGGAAHHRARKFGWLVATELAVMLCQLAIGSVVGVAVFFAIMALVIGLVAQTP